MSVDLGGEATEPRGIRYSDGTSQDTRPPATDRTADPHFDLHMAPGHLLRRNDQRAIEIFQSHVGSAITRQQFAVLNALHNSPGSSQKDLVAATGIDKSTAKEMLSRMVARHWVIRGRDTRDSRAWTLHLTDEGRHVLDTYMSSAQDAQTEILRPLSASEREQLLLLLRKLLGLANEDGA